MLGSFSTMLGIPTHNPLVLHWIPLVWQATRAAAESSISWKNTRRRVKKGISDQGHAAKPMDETCAAAKTVQVGCCLHSYALGWPTLQTKAAASSNAML